MATKVATPPSTTAATSIPPPAATATATTLTVERNGLGEVVFGALGRRWLQESPLPDSSDESRIGLVKRVEALVDQARVNQGAKLEEKARVVFQPIRWRRY